MAKHITVVSGTYNRLPLLQSMIASARASAGDLPLDFVVVDGGSTDGTIDWCNTQDDITLIEHGELRGAIPAFCDGANAATGDYVVLANDDITFIGDGLRVAHDYLNHVGEAGCVAFADNRPAPPYKTEHQFRVMSMPATRDGKAVHVFYAQVGMFRRDIGNRVGWWGADDPDFPARTYGGDNYLSARLWELGYRVDAVDGCRVLDSVHRDELRLINTGDISKGHPDSDAYYRCFPTGPVIPDTMQRAGANSDDLRILYLPIYEPGYAVQKAQKSGLYDALQKVGWCVEIDYLAIPPRELYPQLAHAMHCIQPHVVVSQFQDASRLSREQLCNIRKFAPHAVWVNWNGDYWPNGLVSDEMLTLLGAVDLQTTVNADVLDTYAKHSIHAAYWQIGYEQPDTLPDMPTHDVVFLANAYDKRRLETEVALRNTAYNIGLYGSGWKQSDGNTLYDFAAGDALYRNAKLAISDNLHGARGFVSNRLFQALASGCCVLQEHVEGLDELTGLVDGTHYVSYRGNDELIQQIDRLLNDNKDRRRIARNGQRAVVRHHSFDARVRELFTEHLPRLRG